ncbi:hypothetical protein AKO64_1055 [Escherichia coli]|nr:hypothetical protein AKO64_1055 [Escherichia coli]
MDLPLMFAHLVRGERPELLKSNLLMPLGGKHFLDTSGRQL